MPIVRTIMRFVFPAVVALSIMVLFVPMPPGPAHLPDKLVHIITFAGLAGNGVLAQFRRDWLVGALLAYAVGSEILQGLLPIQRHADWRDAVADTVGIVIGLVAGHLTNKALTRVLPA
ncbi:VanZ family protein [Smaragdicoccus niigatensis]|uniref:VanZ family protein n=1 Tax=Smaragdicoccus niigatensis TaxID=359359 RepID=UPI00037806DF|nr:hypothetical protein [Smaragdicoccus niigatensis]